MAVESSSLPWDSAFLGRSPAFDVLRLACAGLDLTGWPSASSLSEAAARREPAPVSQAGRPIRFAAQVAEDGLSYETRIHNTGTVLCRECDWHDFMNALTWMNFPRAKAMLNSRHIEAMRDEVPGQRGRLRDALTVFDEGGVVVCSTDAEVLADIRAFRWRQLFWQRRQHFIDSTRVFVFGHAMHQKLLEPFIGVSALALLMPVAKDFPSLLLPAQLRAVDDWTAAQWADVARIRTPQDLAPLPLLGVPGWFAQNQHESFYDNAAYFRPGRGRAV